MNKKGFTLVELLGVIVLITIIAGLAIISVSNVINSGKKGLYKNYENALEGASRNAISDYIKASSKDISNSPFLSNLKTKWESKNITLSYQDLVKQKYLDELDDPNGGDCSYSYVQITRGVNIGNNFDFKYKSCVICKDTNDKILYKTEYKDGFEC